MYLQACTHTAGCRWADHAAPAWPHAQPDKLMLGGWERMSLISYKRNSTAAQQSMGEGGSASAKA